MQRVGHAPVVAGLAAGPGQVPGIAPALGGSTTTHAHFVAVVVGFQDDVDHAGNRIRAIDGRGTTGQHFDALHCRSRNVAVVGEVGFAAIRQWVVGHATAVDQQQRAVRAHPAQVQAAGVGRVRAPLRSGFNGAGGLGERLQRVVHAHEAFLLDLRGGDHVDRCRAFDAGALDARAGDSDGVEILGGRTGSVLRTGSEGQQGQEQGLGQQVTTLADGLSHGWLLFESVDARTGGGAALRRIQVPGSVQARCGTSPVDRSKLKHS